MGASLIRMRSVVRVHVAPPIAALLTRGLSRGVSMQGCAHASRPHKFFAAPNLISRVSLRVAFGAYLPLASI